MKKYLALALLVTTSTSTGEFNAPTQPTTQVNVNTQQNLSGVSTPTESQQNLSGVPTPQQNLPGVATPTETPAAIKELSLAANQVTRQVQEATGKFVQQAAPVAMQVTNLATNAQGHVMTVVNSPSTQKLKDVSMGLLKIASSPATKQAILDWAMLQDKVRKTVNPQEAAQLYTTGIKAWNEKHAALQQEVMTTLKIQGNLKNFSLLDVFAQTFSKDNSVESATKNVLDTIISISNYLYMAYAFGGATLMPMLQTSKAYPANTTAQ